MMKPRIGFTILLLALASAALPSCRRGEDPHAADDAAVLAAALEHFRNADTHSPSNGTVVLVSDSTPGKSGMLAGHQLRMELESWGRELPEDAMRSLRRRNRRQAALPPFAAGMPDVTMTDALPSTRWPFSLERPEIRACLDVWLPGYSADGCTAAVRFWYGPLAHSDHAATGTYRLGKRGKDWSVEWAFFSEYP